MYGKRASKGAIPAFIETAVAFDLDYCLLWPFHTNAKGYPRFNGGSVARVVCERVNGAPPTPRHQTAHSCGNGMRGCLTPAHLRWDTPKGNNDERIEHGTMGRKLNDDKVRHIRILIGTTTQAAIARQFGVDRTVIRDIANGSLWAHVV
jgi:hypothetical protein